MRYYVDVLPDDIQKGTESIKKYGVPYTKIPYTQEYHPHATNIACYTIRTEEEKPAQWLLDNMNEEGAIVHHFKFPWYKDFPSNWVGGLAQGFTISALVRMYTKTNDEKYLGGAKLAYNALTKYCIDRHGWIYEFPNVKSILNGNLYTILALFDIQTYFTNAEATFRKCVNNIYNNIKNYDCGYWSYYDLERKIPATPFYHNIHVKLLFALYKIDHDHRFFEYANLFGAYEEGFSNKHWASIHRLYTLWREHGILELYKRNKLRKGK